MGILNSEMWIHFLYVSYILKNFRPKYLTILFALFNERNYVIK